MQMRPILPLQVLASSFFLCLQQECTCPAPFASSSTEARQEQGRGRGARRQRSDARCCNGPVVKYSL